MRRTSRLFSLSASAAAAALMLSACGGGDAGAPPDIVAPTLTITDSVDAASTNGPVTFTFTFSEDVGTSFTAEDVVVTGGTAGTLTMVSATVYTMAVTPTANAAGTMAVNVAAAKYRDLGNNDNTTESSASQAYDTQVVLPSGATGNCVGANCTSFSAAGIGFGPFENQGGGTVEIADDPNDATNKVVKFVKKVGDPDYFGTTITGLAGPFVLTDSNKTITLRVWSPAAGTNMLLKLEGGAGGAATEKDMVTTQAGAWETLSFEMPAAGSFTTVVVFPNGRSTVSSDTTIYIDELTFPAAAAAGSSCAAPSCINFSAAGIGFGPFENQAGGTVEIAADPLDAGNQVIKFVKKPGDGDYFGTTITGLGVSAVLTANAKTVTMRVYSPAVGTNFLLKFEGGVGGPAVTEKDAVTTTAGAWETLTFEMPDAGTYSTVVLFPHGRSGVSTNTTMFVDDLKFPASQPSAPAGGAGGFVGGVFADDYVGNLPTAQSSVGGDVGFFMDDRLFNTKSYDYGGVAGTAQDPGGVHNFYYGLGLNLPALTDAYFGGFVKAPGNTAVDVSGYANLKLNVWGPDQLFKAGSFPALNVVMNGPAVAGCSSGSGGSEIETTFNTTTQGAASVYTLPLSAFTLKAACGSDTTVADVLAHILTVNVILKNANVQYVNKDPDGVAYTNGLNIGKISFE